MAHLVLRDLGFQRFRGGQLRSSLGFRDWKLSRVEGLGLKADELLATST